MPLGLLLNGKQIQPRRIDAVAAVAEKAVVFQRPRGNRVGARDAQNRAQRRAEIAPKVRFLAAEQGREHLPVPVRIALHIAVYTQTERNAVWPEGLRASVDHAHADSRAVRGFLHARVHADAPIVHAAPAILLPRVVADAFPAGVNDVQHRPGVLGLGAEGIGAPVCADRLENAVLRYDAHAVPASVRMRFCFMIAQRRHAGNVLPKEICRFRA